MKNIAPVSTHTATLNGESIGINADNWNERLDELFARHPGVDTASLIVEPVSKPAESTNDTPSFRRTVDGEISETGRARAQRDEDMATENGFAVAPPVYSIGTIVNDLGTENARKSQAEHAEKPSARLVCRNLVVQVQAEQRQDIGPIALAQTRMSSKGQLVVGQARGSNFTESQRLGIEERGFRKLAQRCIPAKSAAPYLSECSTDLRARNWNNWAAGDDSNITHVLRTRQVGNHRVVFSAVSEGYTPFDADKIAMALEQAFPSDAKGTCDYDGFRMRVEGLWHSDVAPEEFVAGEIFKAGVIVRSDDTGGGSIRVQSVIWRNLCRNLIILDRAIGVDLRLRHTGTVDKLASELRGAFGKALMSVDGFRHAWGSAMQERDAKLVERVQGTTSDDISGLPASVVLAGMFNAMIKRELVSVRGRVQDLVPKLMELHGQDEARDQYGLSRASIVNTFTRYAHQVETDPFAADAIREGAGRLLVGRGNKLPAPLPFESFS